MQIKKSTKVGILSILSFISLNFMSFNLHNSVQQLKTNINQINSSIDKISYKQDASLFDVNDITWKFVGYNNNIIKIFSQNLKKEIVLIHNEGTSYYLIQKAQSDTSPSPAKWPKNIYKYFDSIDAVNFIKWDDLEIIFKEVKATNRLVAVEITKIERF